MKVEFLHNTPLRCTLEPHYFEFLDGKTYKIEQGFFYDSASIPRVVKFLDNGRNERAYLVHDWGYSQKCTFGTRKDWDLQLFSDLKSGWERYFIYSGLRIGAWYSWKKDLNYKKFKTNIEKYENNQTDHSN